MADRLRESNNVLIQSLKENAKKKKHQQSTNNWLKVWKSWASQKGYDESIEKYEPEPLSKILEEFSTQQFVRKTGKITSLIAFV